MKLFRYRGQLLVEGRNSLMRKLLGASIVPAKQLKAQEADKSVQVLIESAYKAKK
jgi:hypothetical protein